MTPFGINDKVPLTITQRKFSLSFTTDKSNHTSSPLRDGLEHTLASHLVVSSAKNLPSADTASSDPFSLAIAKIYSFSPVWGSVWQNSELVQISSVKENFLWGAHIWIFLFSTYCNFTSKLQNCVKGYWCFKVRLMWVTDSQCCTTSPLEITEANRR